MDAGLRVDLPSRAADLTDGDIIGSPYAVSRYQVSADLGAGRRWLVRASFATFGMRMMLDFVPNHTATTMRCSRRARTRTSTARRRHRAVQSLLPDARGPHRRARARSYFTRPGGTLAPEMDYGHRPPAARAC